MTAKTSTGDIPFEFGTKNKDQRTQNISRPPGKAFNMLIIGNVLGTSYIDGKPVANTPDQAKPIKIDRDNLEEVMSKLQPSLNIPINNRETNQNTVKLSFNNLDDFHPDQLYQNVELFAEFRALRRKLKKDSSFEAAAKKMDQWISIGAQVTPAKKPTNKPSHAQPISNVPTEGLLDSILGGEDSGTNSAATETDKLVSSLIQDAIATYATPAPNPQKQQYIDALDQTISSTMAALLHHPEFQALEAAWRGLDLMTRRVETDSQLTLRLLPLDKQSLLIDLAEHQDATHSEFSKLVYDAAMLPQQDDRWSVVIGLYDFADNKNDALMLGILAKVMANADTPFIAAGDASLANCSSYFYQQDVSDWQQTFPNGFQETWSSIRQMPEAQYIALASPRFLVRYPYGRKSQRIEAFDLEETDSSFNAAHFLWCNGAIAHAIALCKSFSAHHWKMSLGDINELERLPLAFYDDDGEQAQIPTAEIFLTESAFEALTSAGLAPLISRKGSDHLQLGPLLSISQQRSPLKGPWTE
ncbi:MAG: hypothetical protein COA99_16505 [Moraxellaceae bacterium]|nr:MAG: hypothetical protein COA99_16505 [Moraxellaceae bacterium]